MIRNNLHFLNVGVNPKQWNSEINEKRCSLEIGTV